MNSNPLISVIIPVFNVEQYLEECLNSVLNQTYGNIEIIAVNDGSTDGSLGILEKYALKHSNIVVISQGNAGVSVSRNTGIEKATGKYAYFLDSDDYIMPETFENIINLMETNEVDLVRFGAEPFLDGFDLNIDKMQYDQREYFEVKRTYNKEQFLSANLRAFRASCCLYIFKRELISRGNLRFKPGILHEDELFTLELLLNINTAMYDHNLYFKRRYRSNSRMTSQGKERDRNSFDSYYVVIEEMNKLLKKYKNPAEVKMIQSRLRGIYIGLIHKDIDERYKKERLMYLKGLGSMEKLYYTIIYNVKKRLKMIF